VTKKDKKAAKKGKSQVVTKSKKDDKKKSQVVTKKDEPEKKGRFGRFRR
jgi:hypothetical protein